MPYAFISRKALYKIKLMFISVLIDCIIELLFIKKNDKIESNLALNHFYCFYTILLLRHQNETTL
jgi:hypothetical protein